MPTCPHCTNGRRTMIPVFARPKISAEQAKRLAEELSICDTCGGTSEVTDGQLQAIRRGEELRRQRLAEGRGLHAEALRLGIPASELCAIERGRVSPGPGALAEPA